MLLIVPGKRKTGLSGGFEIIVRDLLFNVALSWSQNEWGYTRHTAFFI
jgi:hypothetical protein